MVPEQYRKSFRELKRQQGQTYVEFVRENERYLERWIKSKNVCSNFDKLRNFVLMEEFENCIPIDVRNHISDRGEEDVHKAEVLADDFEVTHQAIRN